jgi:hypothetical protein
LRARIATAVALAGAFAALALSGGCRDQDSGACPSSNDCASCTQSGCEYCLEDGRCTEPGEPCGGDVARTAGECESEEEAQASDAGATVTALPQPRGRKNRE